MRFRKEFEVRWRLGEFPKLHIMAIPTGREMYVVHIGKRNKKMRGIVASVCPRQVNFINCRDWAADMPECQKCWQMLEDALLGSIAFPRDEEDEKNA